MPAITKKNLFKLIEKVLSESEDSRNSDKTLTLLVWKEVLGPNVHEIKIEKIFDLPDVSSISRLRRVIQNTHRKYIPTKEEVAKRRQWKLDEWHALLSELSLFPNGLGDAIGSY